MGTIKSIGLRLKVCLIAVFMTAAFISCSQVEEVGGETTQISSKAILSGGIVVHFEKPDSWNSAWIWYDQHSDGSWETTQTSQSPGDMVKYRTVSGKGWYKKEFSSTSSVTFLFNKGDWGSTVKNSGSDFVTTADIWVNADGSYAFTDPHSSGTTELTVYFKKPSGWSSPNIYSWVGSGSSTTKLSGNWPGTSMVSAPSEGTDWYKYTISGYSSANIIFNDGSNQTADLSRSSTGWYKDSSWYDSNPDGSNGNPPVITISPGGQTFTTSPFNVNIKITGSATIVEKTAQIVVNNGSAGETNLSSTDEDINLASYCNPGDTLTLSVYAEDSNGESTNSSTETYTYQQSNGLTVYFKKPSDWGSPKIYSWKGSSTQLTGGWPGTSMTSQGGDWYSYTISNESSANIIFNDGTRQTVDLSRSGDGWFEVTGQSNGKYTGTWSDANPDDTVDPTVSITSPSAGSNISGTVNITVNAQDNNGVAKVEFYYGASKIGESTSSPFTLNWNSANSPNKTDYLKAIAYDSANNSGESATVQITTSNANTPPVADAGGNRTVIKGRTFTFNGSGSNDPNGYITTYSWTDGEGGTMSGESPSHVYNNVGTYTVRLTVTDNDGATDSDEITVTVTEEQARTDFREETIYFLLPTRFYDGDSSNNQHCWDDVSYFNHAANEYSWQGDYYGLIQKLDYIKALGFSAIWITPPVKNASGYDYHGYHAVDFTEVDPRFKTSHEISAEEAYEDLIAAVHAKGMKIIQDVVYNHTSNFGEENLYPLFTKNSSGYISLDNPDNMTANSTLNSAANNKFGQNYSQLTPGNQYASRIDAMKTAAVDSDYIYHHHGSMNWDTYDSQIAQIAGDCVDINTENPTVINYLINAYNGWINKGVDGFRVDTVKHVSRLMWNKYFIPAAKATGGDNFYIFGEVCSRDTNVWYRNTPPLSTPFYTWKESQNYSTGTRSQNEAAVAQHWNDNLNTGAQPTSTNHYLNGNSYHTPDWSMRSGMDVIDFPLHHNFRDANSAFHTVKGGDNLYNDATWNVTYVDSHDYGPNTIETIRYNQGTAAWAENLSLMFTWRGIPCIYYGSEIEFQKGVTIDGGASRTAIESTGRAYFGDNLQGSVTATDFGEYSASGTVASTLNHSLAKHIMRLNKIRRAIPALQKGQYSTDNISGNLAYKKRFTDSSKGIDSFVLVTISGNATFNSIPNGKYVDAVTGNVINVSNGSLTANCSGQGNMRAYVLELSGNPAPGKIGNTGTYLK